MKSDAARSTGAGSIESRIDFDRMCSKNNKLAVIGIDEAGRGPLAGPVVAAAVQLDYGNEIPLVNDSKKLSAKKRDSLYDEIIRCARGWAVGIVEPKEIDRINILQATYKAMADAVHQLECCWDLLLVDGNRKIPALPSQQQCTVVKGDSQSAAIAAASILAKVTRDRIMDSYHSLYPQYHFDRHKGYGTKLHCEAIRSHGISPIHRTTFCNQLIMQTELHF